MKTALILFILLGFASFNSIAFGKDCSKEEIQTAFQKLFNQQYEGQAYIAGEAWTDSFPFEGFNSVYKNKSSQPGELSEAKISVHGYLDIERAIVGLKGYSTYDRDSWVLNSFKKLNPGIVGYGNISEDCLNISNYMANSFH